jgi:capsular exopolysaccharide synthesis family protein
MSETRNYQPDPSPSSTDEAVSIDVRAIWRTIVRRRWLIIPFFAAVVLITTLITLRQTKIYDAVCTIVIDLQAPRVLDKEQVQDVVDTGSLSYSREYYETQYRVITSRAVAQRVSDRLQLATNPRLLGLDQPADPASPAAARRFDPIPLLQTNLRVEPIKDSRIVRIRFEDPDPQFAALISNTVAEAYIAENLSVRSTTTASAAEWLEGQLTELEKKLDVSGKALFEFKKSHDIVAASWEDRQSMVSQRLTATNAALTSTRVRRAELQARNEAMEAATVAIERGDSEVEALQPVATNTAIQNIKTKYFDALTDCADLRVKYLENHPKLEACDQRITVARLALKGEIKTAIQAARKEYLEVVKTERNLLALLNDAKGDAFGLNQYEREYLELKRTYDNNQRLYEMFLKRLKDAGVSGMLQVSNVRILDRALPSGFPIRPNVARNLLLAIIFGLVGGVALAFGAEYLDRTITSQQQVEETLGLTFLGIVPSIERNKDGTAQDLYVHTGPKSAVAECLRAVRTNLLFMSPEKPLKTIMVTSSGPQEGKTTTATSLAITMAGSGNRVLLVDGDMRRPRIHRIFGVPSHGGLSSLILGDGSLASVIQPTVVENLSVLPCGPIPPNPAELLHTAAFQRILSEAAQRFDRVIIDSPPIGVVADAVVMATQVDGTLVVLKAGKTDRDVARQAVKQLTDVRAPVFGAVLNDLDLSDQKYGQYSYYYQYGYYYGESRPKEAKVTAGNG